MTNSSGDSQLQKPDTKNEPNDAEAKAYLKSCSSTSADSGFSDMHSQVTTYAKLAESAPIKSVYRENNELMNELTDESGLLVLPVLAESAKLLPDRKDNAIGSDIVLETILEVEVARNAKEFFAQQHSALRML